VSSGSARSAAGSAIRNERDAPAYVRVCFVNRGLLCVGEGEREDAIFGGEEWTGSVLDGGVDEHIS
jgi:hypothetical protein